MKKMRGKSKMNDLISRQIIKAQMMKYGFRAPDMTVTEFVEDCLPSAQPEQRWIPCNERLPYAEYGESDMVLTTCGYRDVEDTSVRWIRLLYFNGGNWCYPTGETYEAKVYAWMPLPKPWKGEKDDTD